ncbi:MAG TPA: rod shape-determining protein MreC [Spirochaetota bacterium]|nr:rod shape-determining protein MreC [Spirochaetota bacterium]
MAKSSRHRDLIILAVLLFISFTFMGFSQTRVTIRFKSVAYAVAFPFQYSGVKSISFVKDFFTSIKNNKHLKGELAATKTLLDEYKRTQYEFEEIKRENERLRNLIGIQSELEYETVIAEVVAKSPQNLYKTIIVNRGKESGIERWMPVVAYQDGKKCVVGKVIDVQIYSARIQPLNDQSNYLGAMLKDTRYSGLLVGQSPVSEQCLLQYIDRRADISYGDSVVTSGMGGVFPKGILIGEVVSVSKKTYGIFQEAQVRPKVDFGRLEEVYIITKSVTEDYFSDIEF